MDNTERSTIYHIDLNACQIQAEALRLIPEPTARKHNALPIAVINGSLQVAMVNADDILTLEALALTRLRIEPVVAPLDEIQQAIDRSYKTYGEIEEQLKMFYRMRRGRRRRHPTTLPMLRLNPDFRAWAKRLRERPAHANPLGGREIVGAALNKLLRLAFALVKNQTYY